jgi:subtilisin family serine protease
MTAARPLAAALAVLAVAASPAMMGAIRPVRPAPAAAPAPHLMAFGGRSDAQQQSGLGGKLDAALADLVRHANRVRPGHELADLHALSPAARFLQRGAGAAPLIAIDAVTRGDPRALQQALTALGLQHAARYANDVGGWLPVSAIGAAAARGEVLAMRAALSRMQAAVVTSQGDFAQGSKALRTTYPTLDGSGVTVGILSDSFNCYAVYAQAGSGVPASGTQGYAPNGFAHDDAAFDESNGYLPASVEVVADASCLQYGQPLQLPFTDEGRAMLQIVHDVAPGAALAFYTASNSEADFANGIGALARAGAKVIADDTFYFDEPFFQDGMVAQAIDAAAATGVTYFSAAGNNGQLSYENTAPSFSGAGSGQTAGELLLNFDPSGATMAYALPVSIPALFPGEFVALIVQWDQPYVTGAPGSPGASSNINLCVSGAGADTVLNLDGQAVTCTAPNATGQDALQVLILGNPANAVGNTAAVQINIVIGLANGTAAPGRIKLVVADDGAGSTIDSFDTHSPTLQGHPGAAGAAAVAAAFFAQTPGCGTTPAILESFSAAGGEPILFDTAGSRLATPQVRQKPDFTGPDGVNTSFFGFFLAGSGYSDTSSVTGCANDASYLNFFGTSAATPHAAGAAALMLQSNPALTPAQILASLRNSAQSMAGNTPNYDSGYGFIQVDAAMKLAPPGPPSVQLSAASITLGSSSTLSWLAVNTTSCTASGSWSGSQAASGSQIFTPTAAGTYTYTLTCMNAAGSQDSSAKLSVQSSPAPASGGGGGAGDALSLLALLGWAWARSRRVITSPARRVP